MRHLLGFFALILIGGYCTSQTPDSLFNGVNKTYRLYAGKVEKKLSSISNKLTKKSEKYLRKLQKHEDKIFAALSKLESNSTLKFAADSKNNYAELIKKITSKSTAIIKLTNGE